MTNDADPQLQPFGTNPEKDRAEIDMFLKGINTYIDTSLFGVEAYDDTSWDGETGVWTKDGIRNMAKDGSMISTSAVDFRGDPGQSNRDISYSDKKRYYSVSQYNDGKLLIFVTQYLPGHEPIEYEMNAANLEEAAQDVDFYDALATIYGAIQDPKFADKKEDYRRRELPGQIEVTALGDSEQAAVRASLATDSLLPTLKALPRPTHRMTSGDDNWLASSPVQYDGRRYVSLYVPSDGENPYQVHTVYTSNSQAAWRLLPGVGDGKDEYWHKKPMSEEVITLPYQMQTALWTYVEATPAQKMSKTHYHMFMDDVKTLTSARADVFLEGYESEKITLWHDTAYSKADLDMLPVESTNTEPVLYSFSSHMYGDIDARAVPSRNGELTYITYTRSFDGIRWVGMIQPNNAKMLDSFLLDKIVVAPGYYESPMEYEDADPNDPDKHRGYEDNKQRVLGSIAVQALNGVHSPQDESDQ